MPYEFLYLFGLPIHRYQTTTVLISLPRFDGSNLFGSNPKYRYLPLWSVSGFPSVSVNWASMKNTGWEFSLNTINIDTHGFRWTSNFNFGYNYNEILDVYSTPTYGSMTNAQRTDYASAAIVGKPINGLWSYKYAGLNEEGRAQFYNEKGEKVLKGMNNIEGLVYSADRWRLLTPWGVRFTCTVSEGRKGLILIIICFIRQVLIKRALHC